jgi:hypothetical protein
VPTGDPTENPEDAIPQRAHPLNAAQRLLTTPGHMVLYFISAGIWVVIALIHSSFLPVFPIFIAIMLLGVYFIPAWLRSRL